MVLTEIHNGDEAYLTRTITLDAEGVVVERTPARVAMGRHAWLEFALDAGYIVRVLAEVVGRSATATRYRFTHFWPRDRRIYLRRLKALRAAA